MAANPLRAEAEAEIGGRLVTFRVTMDGLARLSAEIGATSLGEITMRLRGMEPRALLAAVECFAVGDGAKAREALQPGDMFAVHAAVTAAFVAAFPASKPTRGKAKPAANPSP